MKNFKAEIVFVLFSLLLLMLSASGCSCSENIPLSGFDEGSSTSRDRSSSSADVPGSNGSSSNHASNGLLTAGSVDDHLNFEHFKKFLQKTRSSTLGLPDFSPKQASPRFSKPGSVSSQLDLAFVIDTTGSMSDELNYITSELSYIVEQVRQRFPKLALRYALVVYRDDGDAYVSKEYNFTNLLLDFRKEMSIQRADGGGDHPEAVHKGLERASQLSWQNNATRVAFWIADAPPHDRHMKETMTLFQTLQKMNVRLYPIAASGAQEKAEYIMRAGAFLTGGQYLFLTDDSGIGNSHAEPNVLCYHVEKLKDVMIRMIQSEVSSQRLQPKPDQIIRTVGSVKDGKCMPQK